MANQLLLSLKGLDITIIILKLNRLLRLMKGLGVLLKFMVGLFLC